MPQVSGSQLFWFLDPFRCLNIIEDPRVFIYVLMSICLYLLIFIIGETKAGI